MINVRVNKELEEKLNQYSQQKNLSKSSIVKEALAQYFKKEEMNQTPYELGSDLFGIEGSGNANASSGYKKALKQKLNEKHTH
ncbi:ribbon-helix-helix domain-containing protein [Fulvivirga maritima]|uniref:ribbon-helix-helix domain-containing protein n=1 Tax=Fulvivirga maritima TaxID=2904247 RepID=UPI001F2FC51A|nr:ribbon-helix-helix domain-containing protein [Fulvivirga maritima]UII26374.1 ribbon-helix-helix domain-containing protein [Fulvivirga maritima]